MTNERETADPSAKPFKPYQFTVRTFFAAAIWLSLLLAAINTLERGWLLGTVVLLLAWIAFAELYRRFRATRPMVALCGGPVVLLVIYCIVLIAAPSSRGRYQMLPPVAWFFFYALAWGIALSVVVVIERGVDRWLFGGGRRRRNADSDARSDDPASLRASSRFRYAAVLFSIHTVLTIVAATSWVGRGNPQAPFAVLGFSLLVVMDLPVVPVYVFTPGFDPPRTTASIVAASLLFGGALYAATGFLVAAFAERFRRRPPLSSPPSDASSENPSTRDDHRR
jgi:hypothetical protein